MNDERGKAEPFIVPRSSFIVLFVSLAPDTSPQRIEPLLDPLVSAIDLMDVVDDALPFRAERGQEQGHAGADVGAGDLGALQASAADDDGAMRIAEDDPRPHRDQLVREE